MTPSHDTARHGFEIYVLGPAFALILPSFSLRFGIEQRFSLLKVVVCGRLMLTLQAIS